MKYPPKQSLVPGSAVISSVLLWFLVAPMTAFFWTLFLVWAAFKLDSRIIGYGAVALLVVIPIVLSIETYEWMGEQLAVYVFYLLCITVTLQILELIREGSTEEESADLNEKQTHDQIQETEAKVELSDYSK